MESRASRIGGGFPIDGILMTRSVLKGHLEPESERNCVRKEVWARIATPIQIALVIIQVAVSQTIRGVLLIAAGALSLNGRVCVDGIKDLICVPVQVVALVIIALISIFLPRVAFKITKAAVGSFNFKMPNYYIFTQNPVRGRIISFVVGVISVPVSIVKNVTNVPIMLLSLQPRGALASLVLIFKDGFGNLAIAFGSIGPASVRRRVFYSFSVLYAANKLKEMKTTKDFHDANSTFKKGKILMGDNKFV